MKIFGSEQKKVLKFIISGRNPSKVAQNTVIRKGAMSTRPSFLKTTRVTTRPGAQTPTSAIRPLVVLKNKITITLLLHIIMKMIFLTTHQSDILVQIMSPDIIRLQIPLRLKTPMLVQLNKRQVIIDQIRLILVQSPKWSDSIYENSSKKIRTTAFRCFKVENFPKQSS